MATISIVEMPLAANKYHLVTGFLRLRKAIFVDKMDWPLYHYEKIEFEQYDSFHAVYIIAHNGDDVIGGARLIRTDRRLGTGTVKYSYMIRDAYEGLLPGMPTEICYDEPPSEKTTWELTRLATLPHTDVAEDILHSANDFLATRGANQCLFLGPPAFLRMARNMSYAPERLGPVVRNDDGSFLAFACPVITDRCNLKVEDAKPLVGHFAS